MATKKQKEELIQTLKFNPVQARILIQGYGGECYIGSVDRETYDFFKSKKIDVEQFVNDWDDALFSDVPSKHRFVEPGSPYECDNLFHQSGATLDSGSYITVEDEEGNVLWNSDLDFSTLADQGVTVESSEDFDSDDLEPGSVVFWGGQGEKGCFFDGEVLLREPFDPGKLTIYYGNGDGWYITGGVEYDGEEIEGSGGYSTTGKWAEHKFWIAGDEEVYTGEERDEDFEPEEWDPAAELEKIQVPVLEGEEEWAQQAIDESMLSVWHPGDLKPIHEGEYEVEFVEAKWPYGQGGYHEFRDGQWQTPEGLVVKQWRGLREPFNG